MCVFLFFFTVALKIGWDIMFCVLQVSLCNLSRPLTLQISIRMSACIFRFLTGIQLGILHSCTFYYLVIISVKSHKKLRSFFFHIFHISQMWKRLKRKASFLFKKGLFLHSVPQTVGMISLFYLIFLLAFCCVCFFLNLLTYLIIGLWWQHGQFHCGWAHRAMFPPDVKWKYSEDKTFHRVPPTIEVAAQWFAEYFKSSCSHLVLFFVLVWLQ